jgi:hypothetical protein
MDPFDLNPKGFGFHYCALFSFQALGQTKSELKDQRETRE